MLCCVSRKASPRSRNKKTDNSHESHKNSALHHDSTTSSGISSSSFDSSDNFNFSHSSNLTVSSSSTSQNTSGFSSSPAIRKFENSSSDTFSIPSEFSSNHDEASTFLANNSNVIHTLDPNSSTSEPPKRLKTFSTPAKPDYNHETPINVESNSKPDISAEDEPSELLPCAICARTFKPQSLEKHTVICERSALKKRKPFDSAKQRIQGTELAEFLPKETTKRKAYQTEDRTTNNKGSWKQTHDQFLQAIRAARGETIEVTRPHQLVPASTVTVGVPTRPNEKGMCPTCNRQFSIKSYERHVEWCKDRATKVPMSAATNIAKERLEARMKYRAPALKNRRTTVREKYSPSSASNLGGSTSNKINNGNVTNQRAKETSSTPNCQEKTGNETATGNSQSQKSTANTRRLGQGRETMAPGPMKSRLSDRSNRPSGENDSGTTSNFPTPRENSSRVSKNPIPRYPRNSPTKTHLAKSWNASGRAFHKIDYLIDPQDDNEENFDDKIHEQRQKPKGVSETSTKHRRARHNIVHARSCGNPRINDVTINDDVMGMTVQPCVRKKINQFDEEFVTWKKISEESLKCNDFFKFHSVKATKCMRESETPRNSYRSDLVDDELNVDMEKNEESKKLPPWTSGTEKLDQTFSIRESLDAGTDGSESIRRKNRRPVIDSPRNGLPCERNPMENHFPKILDDAETSARSTHQIIKRGSDRTLEKNFMIASPSFPTCPKLEPLNLHNLENGDELEASIKNSCRSETSSISTRRTSRTKSKKVTPKLGRVIADESPRSDPENGKVLVEKNDGHSAGAEMANMLVESLEDARSSKKPIHTEPVDRVDMGNDVDQDSRIVETPRSSKSARLMKNWENKLPTKTVTKMNVSVDGNESTTEESLTFESADDRNREKPLSESISQEIDEKTRSFDFPESPESNESPKNDWQDIARRIKRVDSKESFSHDSLNCTSRNDKNRSTTMNDDSAMRTSRSQKSGRSPKINCEDLLTKKMEKMQSIVKNLNIFSRDHQKKENSRVKEIDIVPNKVDGENEKPTESSEKGIDKKIETKIETKINYARCKTYVIEKKGNSNNDKKHHAPQELPDDKPLQKKRKTESPDMEKMSNVEIDDSIQKKLTGVEVREDKIESNVTENSSSKSEECPENSETANNPKTGKIENINEFNEKYINQKFNYDSDETLRSENCLKDSEPGGSIKVEEKLSSVSDASYLEIYQKSFSDSYMPREEISVDTFLRMQLEPEVENFQNPRSSEKPDGSEIPKFTQTVQESQNPVEEPFPTMHEQPEVNKSSEVPNKVNSANLNCETLSAQRKSPEILNAAETAQSPQQGETTADTSRGIEEKETIKNGPERTRIVENKNTLESSRRNDSEASEARKSDERRQKFRNPSSAFPKVSETAEERNFPIVRKNLRSNNLMRSVESADEALNSKNSLPNMSSFETRSMGDIEEETIQEIVFGKVGEAYENKIGICGFLPEIPIDRINTKTDNSKSGTLPLEGGSFVWQRGFKNSTVRLINLDLPKFNRETKIPSKRLNNNVGNLPPVAPFREERRRISDREPRAVWSKYVRRHPDFNLVLTGRTGNCGDYDPFLIAERQMNELLSDTCSEKSLTDCSSNRRRSSLSPTLPNYPLSHSSAFVKYTDSPVGKIAKLPEKRVSLIAPPTEFDDFSSDSTETNSITREVNNCSNSRSRELTHENDEARRKNVGRDHVLGRRVIIDKSKALGLKENYDDATSIRSLIENSSGNGKVRKLFEKTTPKVTRSNSVRTNSSPKTNEKKLSNHCNSSSNKINNIQNNRNNNYASLSGSNISLSSIVSSDTEVKRSHSAFDELASSCDDDTSGIYPSLRYLLKNDSLSVTSPVQSNRPRNGQISDEEFSSPDSYKRHHEHNKLSADSAYSSLNRKYSNHGRIANDMAGRHDEDSPLHRRDVETVGSMAKSKLSKFCHECGSKFPEPAKFCCECGVKRLAL